MVSVGFFSKCPETVTIPNQAFMVAETLLDNIIPRHRVPPELHSDQRRNFESNIWKDLINLLDIRSQKQHLSIFNLIEWLEDNRQLGPIISFISSITKKCSIRSHVYFIYITDWCTAPSDENESYLSEYQQVEATS